MDFKIIATPPPRSSSRNSQTPPRSIPSVAYNPHTNTLSLTSLQSGTHGRIRRKQRKIRKVDLQKARRYGIKEKTRYGRLKYTYGGITFIYDPVKKKEVTSYQAFELKRTPGSLQGDLIVLVKKEVTPEMLQQHQESVYKLARHELWQSHTVLVVDMSGSMRQDDVAGCRCRSEGVWSILARDFVQKSIQNGTLSSMDVVSIVLMREEPEVVVQYQPVDWILYNRLLQFREWEILRPQGFGNYLPSLAKAEELLHLNKSGTCALALYFLSDGRPSDDLPLAAFTDRVGMIASTLGQRLSASFVGIASPDEDFSILNEMAAEAKEYGCEAAFHKPSLHTSSLSSTVSSMLTSLSHSKLSLSSLRQDQRYKPVRSDIVREKINEPEEIDLTSNWEVYAHDTPGRSVKHIWTWSDRHDNIVPVVDPTCVFCSKLVVIYPSMKDSTTFAMRGSSCPRCKVTYFCPDCKTRVLEHIGHRETCLPLIRMNKDSLTRKALPSFAVALKKTFFGEGAERVAAHFRFIDDEKDFTGIKLIYKESRLDEKYTIQRNLRLDLPEHQREFAARMSYHRSFLRSQSVTQEFARQFNVALDQLSRYFEHRGDEVVLDLPRIRVVEPFVVALDDNGIDKVVLVEELLEGKWTKFNNNAGFVRRLARNSNMVLEAIKEEDEVADEDMDMDKPAAQRESQSSDAFWPSPSCNLNRIQDVDFPQAFSHFSFEKSGGQILVCDLQGVLKQNLNGTREFVFTDPAVHSVRGFVVGEGGFGRTDKHEKGIRAFFKTHVCTDACRVLGLESRKDQRTHNI